MNLFEFISHEELDKAYHLIKYELKNKDNHINAQFDYRDKTRLSLYYEELEETFFQLSQYLGYIEFEGEFV